MKRLPLFLFILLVLAWVPLLLGTAEQLPERVASQFSGEEVTGWMTRAAYLKLMLVVSIGVPLMVVLTMGAIRWIPSGWLNTTEAGRLWLDPAYRPRFNALLLNAGALLGGIVLCFVAAIHGLIVMANRLTPPKLDGSLIALACIVQLALVAMVVLFLLVRLMKAPKAP